MVDERLPATLTDAAGEAADHPEGLKPFTPGQVLGERYRIVRMLGRGGIGEVWHALDLKLRVEVALKALLPHLVANEKRLLNLRQEVRAAREVLSPNVCRVFDLVEVEGRELVSMEFVDGDTLLKVLNKKGPLDLKEAQDIASQFLAGLEAIHAAGLVHRDIKPENIMLTRAGRVVVMDFGLAREPESGAGTVSGTPAYMSPEQAAGQTVDARADVFAAGVVLAEMVSPDGIKKLDSRKSLWEAVRSEPSRFPDTPWTPIIRQAVSKDRDQRYDSAHSLTRALEDVTLRVKGADDLHPYPGLASFTEDDAEFFFGREAEVEQMWRKLDRPHLLAVVGPSGAGKTSFLRAGLIPSAGPGWRILRCTPGSNPFTALGQAMAREMAGDIEAMELFAADHDSDILVAVVGRWSHNHGRALVILDQFEELFTQNPPDTQKRFSNLISRLPLEADVFVMLSMRDDFLIRCREHEDLAPAFTDLTALLAPSGAALRRGLTQPALRCGYRFEDDEFVDEMLAEVEGERGALPLLAFATARLWELRDRSAGLLTREAYQEIGGVGGALAQHAESTIDRIGVERIQIVRELFRNLVTAEGTRAVREWNELLSVFDKAHRDAADEVLCKLIDARLLTSYEVHEDESEPIRRVEIIHESLLANWPRLVRWQTQDADAVQLRDQLRQAAKTWIEHDRHDDLLWTGAAFRECQLWRERYPGGLTDTEEAFAAAMTSLAGRRRVRRHMAVAAILVIAVVVTAVTSILWRRSVLQERMAEAQKLTAVGQLEIDSYPTASVAYAMTSLELADNPAARRLALEALWKGPTAFTVDDEVSFIARFSPDGQRLVQSISFRLRVIEADGSARLLDQVHGGEYVEFRMAPGGEIICSFDEGGLDEPSRLVLWSMLDGQQLAEVQFEDPARLAMLSCGDQRAVAVVHDEDDFVVDAVYPDGSSRRIGNLELDGVDAADITGRWSGAAVNGEIFVVEVLEESLSRPRSIGRHGKQITHLRIDPMGRFLASVDSEGGICIWDLTGNSPVKKFKGPTAERNYVIFSEDGALLEILSLDSEGSGESWVWSLKTDKPDLLRRIGLGRLGTGGWDWDSPRPRFAKSGPDLKTKFWPTGVPADADPVELLRGKSGILWTPSFHPNGNWLSTSSNAGVAVWPLAREYASVIRHHIQVVYGLDFGPKGDWLASSSNDGTVRLWPLTGEVPVEGRVLLETRSASPALMQMLDLAASPSGDRLLVGAGWSGAQVVPIDGSTPLQLSGFESQVWGVAFSPNGKLVAAKGGEWEPREKVIRVWNAATGEEVTALGPDENLRPFDLVFLDDSHILSGGDSGLLTWDLKTGQSQALYDGVALIFDASVRSRRVLLSDFPDPNSVNLGGRPFLFDLESGAATQLKGFGDHVRSVALSAAGDIVVTGDVDGVIRVGRVFDEEPHLLLGHDQSVEALAIDPLGRWIASAGEDTTVRLWPMPDLSKPPLHTLPRKELIAKLKTLTNIRVVRDQDSPTGWKLTHDPFPGWETVPTW